MEKWTFAGRCVVLLCGNGYRQFGLCLMYISLQCSTSVISISLYYLIKVRERLQFWQVVIVNRNVYSIPIAQIKLPL